MLKVLILAVLNLKMLLHGTEGLSLVVQNAAAAADDDIAGNLKEDGAGTGAGAGVAYSNDKEGTVDTVACTRTADKIAVDIEQVVVGALCDREIDGPVGVVSQNRV